jgi:hypothetical protein
VLVDCFFDFGQFAESDTTTSEKPISPFTKILDKCQLGSVQTKTIKQYQPLKNDSTRKQFWVGDGTYDQACFPGNILIWLIDIDHNLATYKNIFPVYKTAAAGPRVESENFNDETFMGTVFKKALIYEYVKPIYQKAVMTLMEILNDSAA